MDPVLPPDSLRHLMKVHRWLNPPAVISLREILARHKEPQGSVRFLAYNTFLLDGFSIGDVSLEMVYELMKDLGVDIVSLYKELALHPAKILQLAGVTVEAFLSFFLGENWARALAGALGVVEKIEGYIDDCLNFTTFGLWGEVKDWAHVGLDMVLGEAGMTAEQALDYLGISPEEILGYLKQIGIDPLSIVLNSFGRAVVQLICAIAGKDVDLDHIKGKPEVPERATELGQVLREPMELGQGVGIFLPYGIMALCEVFSEPTQSRIRAELEGLNCQFLPGSGPSPPAVISGGLYQIIRDLPVRNPVRMPFVNRGDPWQDADYWANKGVLLSRIDVGVGMIEFYSTHTYDGGNLISDPSPEDRLNRKRAQVGELVEFFHANHDPRNVAIICGDFNLYAHRPEEKEIMVWLMQNTGTLDVWDWQWQTRDVQENAGHTAETGGDILALCKIDGTGCFCEDPTDLQPGGRIDWILVENPRPEHTFMLDLSRVRRRPFPRAGGGFLSDHVGLDTTLIASPLGGA